MNDVIPINSLLKTFKNVRFKIWQPKIFIQYQPTGFCRGQQNHFTFTFGHWGKVLNFESVMASISAENFPQCTDHTTHSKTVNFMNSIINYFQNRERTKTNKPLRF